MNKSSLRHRTRSVFGVLAVFASAYGQSSVDLSGSVFDQDGKARVGVVVKLANSDLSDTTGPDGAWSLHGQIVSVRPSQGLRAAGALRWLGRDLVTQFEVPTLVSGDLFDASGRRLAMLPSRIVMPGHQSIALNLPVSSGARWLRVQTGNTSTVLSAGSGISAPDIALPSALARSAAGGENLLIYSLQGQIVTEDKLPSLVQSGIMKYIQDYRVSAPVSLDPRVKVDSVWAWFKGGTMNSAIRAQMGYDALNQLVTGRIYTIKSVTGDVYSFNTWINIYGNGNRLTAVSDTIAFTTLFGNIAWKREFSTGNAFPDGKIVSADSVEAGAALSLSLRLAYLDTANHRVKESVIKAEWDLGDGKGWVVASVTPTATARWHVPGIDTVKLRLMDADSNVAVIVKAIKVVNSGSALRLTSGPADTTITPSDMVSFQLTVRDTSGVARVIWNYGDGKSDTTKTGNIHSAKHAYPGPSVVVPGKDSTFALTVTVIDSLGGTTTQQKLAVVRVDNSLPTAEVTAPASGYVNRAIAFTATTSTATKGALTVVWDFGSGVGTGDKNGATAKWLKPGTYKVKMSVTDEDGNRVVDSSSLVTIDNRPSTVSLTSMKDPNLAVSTNMDTVITPNDEVTIVLSVSDDDGVRAVVWNYGDGTKADTTKTGATHTVKHTYPGVTVVPADSAKRYTLSVRVVDTLGDTTNYAKVAVVKDTNDVPQIASLPDTISFIKTMHTVNASAKGLGKIASYEWSVDGVDFRGTLASDTTFQMPETTSSFVVYVRAVDEDEVKSKVDSFRVNVYEKITDSRDGQQYNIIHLGKQTWMAQNLNYAVDSSWWYNNSADSGAKYGRLYTWASAMGFDVDDSCNLKSCSDQVLAKHQGVCPVQWHIPDSSDWSELVLFGGGQSVIGKHLKSRSGWSDDPDFAPSWMTTFDSTKANGGDAFGFHALPAGEIADVFSGIGYSASWWSTASNKETALEWTVNAGSDQAAAGFSLQKSHALSLRCIKN